MSRTTGLKSPYLLGLDDLERLMQSMRHNQPNSYPPYNIERVRADADQPETLRIVVAVAGFSASDLEVIVENRELTIRGRQSETCTRDYLHRGIAARQFQRGFVLAEGMEVMGARLDNGLLAITIGRPEPSSEVRRIKINASQ